MKTNVRQVTSFVTHEGAPAKRINAELELRRSVMACMLWEDSFYEDGHSIAGRIATLVGEVDPVKCANIAIEAREKMKLRHAPLWIALSMAKLPEHKKHVAATLTRIIQRVDEIAEFLSLYWLDGKKPISAQIKKGLAGAFLKFDEYSFAKYNRDGAIKLRDVMFMVHPKPANAEQELLFKKIANNELATPDTWEVALSAGNDKKETWERLITENKLGGLAALRNLRNMQEVGLSDDVIKKAIESVKTERILPYRFITAARYAPQFEPILEEKMVSSIGESKLPGKTVLLVDVSGSMNDRLTAKSDMNRIDAACGLAILLREICEDVKIYSFSMALKQIPARRGFALRDAIMTSQEHSGTPLGLAVQSIYAPITFVGSVASFGYYGAREVDYHGQALTPDRLIVITDEQSSDAVQNPINKGYMINVSTEKRGVGYGKWLHLDGFSEAIVDYIREYETELV